VPAGADSFMSDTPSVSVIIATYNRANFLRETLESVLHQSFRDFELIVVDDGSTDDTRRLIDACGSTIRYYYQENRGPAAARNLGVRQARAPWLAFQDSDDLSTRDHLQVLHDYVLAHPQYAMVFANGVYLGGHEHRRETIIPARKSRRLAAEGVRLNDLFEKSIARLQAALISKAAYDAAGGMNESLRVCHDLDLFLRLCAKFPVAYLDRVVFRYRKHEGNITLDEEVRLTENIKVIENLIRDFPAVSQLLGHRRVARRTGYRYYRLAKGRWKRNQVEGARQALRGAISLCPFYLKYRYYQLRWGALGE
jgi:glycosyltransferase involved in cell wall biosynthesis